MQIDAQTGVPLFKPRDVRPIKIRLVQRNGQISVVDQETERPIHGVSGIQASWGKNGCQLVLMIAGPNFEVVYEDEAVQVRQPARLLEEMTGRDEPLFDGEEIPILDKAGNAKAIIRVELVKRPEAQP